MKSIQKSGIAAGKDDEYVPAKPTLAAHDPNTVTVTKPVSITIPYGVIGLRTGTKLQLLSRTSDKVRVRYDGTDYDIPISATDLR